MNYYHAEAGYELDREVALIVGVLPEEIDDSEDGKALGCWVKREALDRVFGEFNTLNVFGIPTHADSRFEPSTDWRHTKLVVDHIGFWFNTFVFRSPYDDFPYIVDVGRKLESRSPCGNSEIKGPTLELAFTRAVCVVGWRAKGMASLLPSVAVEKEKAPIDVDESARSQAPIFESPVEPEPVKLDVKPRSTKPARGGGKTKGGAKRKR